MTENTLLNAYTLNKTLTLKNRIAMSPMTRNVASDALVPTDDMVQYYARRAQAALIITEGTIISPDGRGYSNTPGIFTAEQIAGWQKVTDAVHAKGGKIFCQIWHVGRVSHPHFLEGELPISASNTQLEGRIRRTENLHYSQARAATLSDIQSLVESFSQASKNAIAAGFDGVEIHGANGYLIDQFLHYDTNLRTDEYGGSPEKMSRFALEVLDACIDVIGADRVALRLSPGAYLHLNGDPRDGAVFTYLLENLNQRSFAYLHTGNFDDSVTFEALGNKTMTDFMRDHYQGILMACGGYTLETAQQGLDDNRFDLVSLGRPFIANPNLITKAKNGEALVDYDVSMLDELV